MALDDIPDLPAFDLLKIDVQGAEKLAFQGGRQVLANAVAVMVEQRCLRHCPEEPILGETGAELPQQGFGLHKSLSTSRAC